MKQSFFQFKDNTEIRQNLITLLIWMTKKINILKNEGLIVMLDFYIVLKMDTIYSVSSKFVN